jgi:murein DD-endopeptidase MepM/ murein hydrolase activator NlpD
MTNAYILSGLFIFAAFLHCVTDQVNGVSPVPDKRITTPFGKKGSWAAGYHTGDDYACPIGTKVVATRAGVVKSGI